MKNTAQLTTLFALSNLWMARKQLMGMGVRCACSKVNQAEKPDYLVLAAICSLIKVEMAVISTGSAVTAS